MTTRNHPRVPLLSTFTTLSLALLCSTPALAGDLDGDGHDDLLVGVHRLDIGSPADTGGFAILDGTGQGLLGNEFMVPVTSSGARAGFAVATGDFDDDGDDDLAIGAPSVDYYQPRAGAVYIFENVNGTFYQGQTLTRSMFVPPGAIDPDDHFGRALVAGDFDGDGVVDLAMGAPKASNDLGQTGVVYVAFGSEADGLLPGAGSKNRIKYDGAQFGYALAAGDFNGDGQTDLAITAPGYEDAQDNNVGRVTIVEYVGGGAGFDPLYTMNGSTADIFFGWTLASGDFDGDGNLDLAVGAPDQSNQTFVGQVEIFLGSDLETLAQTLTLSPGYNGSAQFGHALAAGDLDGDGKAELAVGAPYVTLPNAPDNAGAVWIYGGGSTLVAWADPLMPSAFPGNNAGTGQKFGCSLAMGYYSYDVTDPQRRLELAVGAKRAKENEIGIRSGAVFMYANDAGEPELLVPGTKTSLEDVGGTAQAGALFGSSLAQ